MAKKKTSSGINVAISTRTSPTISSIPFIPLSTSAEDSEIQRYDRLTGHEGEPIILTKVVRSSKKAKNKLINRLLERPKIWWRSFRWLS
jgi:hypothetical protein